MSSARTWHDWASLAGRLILGGVLLVAGALKLPNLESSVIAVRAYQLLPFDLTRPLGYALPIIEVALGLLLITGTFTRIVAISGGLIMVGFVIAIASVWARGISIDCGCFGGGGEVEDGIAAYPWEIARDVGLIACAAAAAWWPPRLLAVDTWLFAEPAPLDDLSETPQPQTNRSQA
ncbi:MAG: DoxX family membrane protein [Micropruina sp.]|nr:DoxX family membrane protein [Micropruina sp.]